MQKYHYYWNHLEELNTVWCPIVSVTTLSKQKLDDNSIFSFKSLKASEDYSFTNPQGKKWPNVLVNHNFDENLISLLEGEFKDNKKGFKALINHFDRSCYFCNKLGRKSDHRTFIGRNGLPYFEYHHFIQQSLVNQYPELEQKVYSPCNGLYLCSNCHNKFHYGTKEIISEMIKIVLDDCNIQGLLDDGFRKAIGEDINVFDWILDRYLNK